MLAITSPVALQHWMPIAITSTAASCMEVILTCCRIELHLLELRLLLTEHAALLMWGAEREESKLVVTAKPSMVAAGSSLPADLSQLQPQMVLPVSIGLFVLCCSESLPRTTALVTCLPFDRCNCDLILRSSQASPRGWATR